MPTGRTTVLQELQQLNDDELFLLCQDYGLMVPFVNEYNRRHVERRLTVAIIGERARARVQSRMARERAEQYSQNPYARSLGYRDVPARRPTPWRRLTDSTMTNPSVRFLSSNNRSNEPSARGPLPVARHSPRATPLWRRRFPREQESSIFDRALSSFQTGNFFGYQVPSTVWQYARRGLGNSPRRAVRFRGGQGEEQEEENQYQAQDQMQYEERYEDEDQMQSQDQDVEDQQNEEQYQEYGNEKDEDRQSEQQYGNENEDGDDIPYHGGDTLYYTRESHETVSLTDQSEDQRQLEYQLHSTYGENRPQASFNSPLPYDFQELAQLNLVDRLDRIDHLENGSQANGQPDAESVNDVFDYLSCRSSTSFFHDAIEQPVGILRAQPMKKPFDWLGWLRMAIAQRPRGQNERIPKRDQTREHTLENERELATIDYLSVLDSEPELEPEPEQEPPLLDLMSRHELQNSSEELSSMVSADSIGSVSSSCEPLQPGFLRWTYELLFCDHQGCVDSLKIRRSIFCCGATLFLYFSIRLWIREKLNG